MRARARARVRVRIVLSYRPELFAKEYQDRLKGRTSLLNHRHIAPPPLSALLPQICHRVTPLSERTLRVAVRGQEVARSPSAAPPLLRKINQQPRRRRRHPGRPNLLGPILIAPRILEQGAPRDQGRGGGSWR